MEFGEDYNPEAYYFDWNNAKVTASCVCGEPVDIHSDAPSTCSCGRMYWLETKVKIDWADSGDPDQLQGAG